MAAKPPIDEAFEAHLQSLTRGLDLQASLVRSALELHPASSLVDFKEVAEDALSKFSYAIGDLRSDLNAVAAALATAEPAPPRQLSSSASVPSQPGRSCLRPASTATTQQLAAKRASIGSASVGSAGAAEVFDAPRRPSRVPSRSSCGRSVRSGEEADRLQVRALTTSEESAFRSEASDVVSDRHTDNRETEARTLTQQSVKHLSTNNGVQYASRASMFMKMKTRDKPCIGGVFNPDWPVRLSWDMLVILLVSCDAVVIPMQLAEFRTGSGFEDFWLWLTVSIFLCDLVLNFFTGYHDERAHRQNGSHDKSLITDKVSIAIHYLRGWFWIDFLSTVPWHVIAETFKPNSDSDGLKLAKVVKLMRLLRLMRMLRLCKVGVIWERLEVRIGSITALNVVSMLKVLGIWTAICHWGACIWWMVGKRDSLVMLLTFQDDDPEALHWTELPRVHSPYDEFGQWRWVDRPVSEQYVFCFYWVLGVMRTMPAEVTPVNLTERIFVLVFMFFAVMAFAVNVARITQAWFKFSARRDAFKEEMVHVRAHLRSIGCGPQLQTRTRAYLNHLFEKRKLHAKEMGLLGVLPAALKRKLDEAHRIRFLRMIPRLEDWSEPLLRRFCEGTDVLDFLTGDKVTEKNRDAEAAYVLMRGCIHIFTPTLLKRSFSKLSNLSTSSRGAPKLTIVDEHCLFEPGEKAISKNTVLALECSELLRIDRQRFQEVLLAHGPSSEQLRLRSGADSNRSSVSSEGFSQTTGTPSPQRDTGTSNDEVTGTHKGNFCSTDTFGADLRLNLSSVERNGAGDLPRPAASGESPEGTDGTEQEDSVGGIRQVETPRLRMSRRTFGMGSFREWQHIVAGQIQSVG